MKVEEEILKMVEENLSGKRRLIEVKDNYFHTCHIKRIQTLESEPNLNPNFDESQLTRKGVTNFRTTHEH